MRGLTLHGQPQTVAHGTRRRIAALVGIALAAACSGTAQTPIAVDPPKAPPVPPPERAVEVPEQTHSAYEQPDAAAPEAAVPSVPRAVAVRSEWPCPGCLARIPGSGDASRPMPMLILFHGNDGNTHWMDRIWHQAAARHGMIALVLRCPGYGFPSWWRWHESGQHEPGWLRARVAEVAREYPVATDRVYGTGYSGGASYLSAYAAEDPGLFAAVSLVAGGVPPRQCPRRTVPAHILVGSLDTMLPGNVIPFREAWTRCGGEVEWDERAGVTHEGILWNVERGGAEAIVGWLLGKVEARSAAD